MIKLRFLPSVCLDVCLGTGTQVYVILYQPGEILRVYSVEPVCFVWTSAVWKRWESTSLCVCVCPQLTRLT